LSNRLYYYLGELFDEGRYHELKLPPAMILMLMGMIEEKMQQGPSNKRK
jgi:hypothetical protein